MNYKNILFLTLFFLIMGFGSLYLFYTQQNQTGRQDIVKNTPTATNNNSPLNQTKQSNSTNNQILPWERELLEPINGVYYLPIFADIRDIELDDKLVWVAGFAGVFVFDKDSLGLKRVFTQADGYYGIPTALKIVGVEVFVGTQHGLISINKNTGKITSFYDTMPGHEPFNKNISHITYKNGVLIMDTFGGLRHFDIKTHRWLNENATPSQSQHLTNEFSPEEKAVLDTLKASYDRKIPGLSYGVYDIAYVFKDGRVLANSFENGLIIFNPNNLAQITKTQIPNSFDTEVIANRYIWAYVPECVGPGCGFEGSIEMYDSKTKNKYSKKFDTELAFVKNQFKRNSDTLLYTTRKQERIDLFELDIKTGTAKHLGSISESAHEIMKPMVYQPETNSVIAIVQPSPKTDGKIIALDIENQTTKELANFPAELEIVDIATVDGKLFALVPSEGAIYSLPEFKKIWQKQPRTTSPYRFILLSDKVLFKTEVPANGVGSISIFTANGVWRSVKPVYRYINPDGSTAEFNKPYKPMFYNPPGVPSGSSKCTWYKPEYGNGGVWGGCK